MSNKSVATLRSESPYSAVLTREQFLFHEVRITAKLLCQGCTQEEAISKIASENLFQYPTERSLKDIARVCLRRLNALDDEFLVQALATESIDTAKQINLYAMMKQYRLMWDFMVTVIGEKYRTGDCSFGPIDINAFFLRLQEQDDGVATWSDSTVTKLKQVIKKCLVETGYLESTKATALSPMWIAPVLEKAIRTDGNRAALQAFGCI
ncbi:MAG: DUF1819 family protein [Eubacteriales bacterium]|nr:DUF1819 family protein [Eubacteriales bacterium]